MALAANNFQIIPLSDRAVLVSFGNIIDQQINEKVLSLHNSLQQSAFEGFIESVPAYASLAIFFDLKKVKSQTKSTAFSFVKIYLEDCLQRNSIEIFLQEKTIRIPVCYDEEFGIDINQLAEAHGINVADVIRLHTAVIYRVYMIGFTPGFAYMGTLAEQLVTPRKDQPRLHVPAGSVGIAGAQTGVYPVDSPGGWQIIGRTPLNLFDINLSSPCLLSAGDQVQFFSINKIEFEEYHAH